MDVSRGVGVTNWPDGTEPGNVLIAAVAAGGRVSVTGPGDATPGSVRASTPADVGARVAAAGHATEAMVAFEGPWSLPVSARPQVIPAARATACPAPDKEGPLRAPPAAA